MIRRTTVLLALTTLCAACAGQQADKAAADPVAAATEPATADVAPIPEGWFTITPQIGVEDVDGAIAWYGKVMGAETVATMKGPDGKSYHAEIKIGDSNIMVDQAGEGGMPSPKALGGSPMTLMVYVPTVDETVKGATEAGATLTMPVDDQFWGDRYGQVTDPFGHSWAFATKIEDVTDEQMEKRFELLKNEMAQMSDRAAQPKKKGKKKSKKDEPAPGHAWKAVEASPAKSPVPTDYHSVTMAIHVPDTNAVISFYEQAFGATVVTKMDMPNGKVMHAEIKIGDTSLMISDEMPEYGTRSATSLGGSPVVIHHYVSDADAIFAKATGLGAKVAYPMEDAAWGDRYGAVVDPSGLPWGVATRKEDLTPEQMDERMKAMMEKEQAAKASAPDSATAPEKAAADAPPAAQ